MMVIPRVIPCLLLRGWGLVKTRRFRDPLYVGDPVNTIRIFNEKEVDELMLLDIMASREGRGPNFHLISQITSECFMPLAYGGGVTSVEQIAELFSLGVEKVVLNRSAVERPDLVSRAADRFGSQSIVVSIDAWRGRWGGYRVYTLSGTKDAGVEPAAFAARMQEMGAGELLVTSIDRDGTMEGYDLQLIHEVASAVTVPVVASGGAKGLEDFRRAVIEASASAVAAGSLFVFQMPHRAVLISFPSREELEVTFGASPSMPSGGQARVSTG